MFVAHLTRTVAKTGGTLREVGTSTTRLSQYCHGCQPYAKKPLSQRWHHCACWPRWSAYNNVRKRGSGCPEASAFPEPERVGRKVLFRTDKSLSSCIVEEGWKRWSWDKNPHVFRPGRFQGLRIPACQVSISCFNVAIYSCSLLPSLLGAYLGII
jgi:hypothetical protein